MGLNPLKARRGRGFEPHWDYSKTFYSNKQLIQFKDVVVGSSPAQKIPSGSSVGRARMQTKGVCTNKTQKKVSWPSGLRRLTQDQLSSDAQVRTLLVAPLCSVGPVVKASDC